MWNRREGKSCIVFEYIRPDGRIAGVVVQTAVGCTPKVGGKVLPGYWPGNIGAAKKALLNNIRPEKETEMTSKNELAMRIARIARLKLELAKLQTQTGPKRHAVAAAAQEQNHSNWFKTQHVSGRGYVRYVDAHTYAAFVDGVLLAVATGKSPTAARNAAKKIVTRELSDRGIRWQPRVFG